MTVTLWDTNGSEIVKALAAERRTAGALATGLALTLVVVTDEKDAPDAEAAANAAAAAHPCRLLIVVRRRLEADDRLDAEVQVGGRLGTNEAVVMRMYGRLTVHAESVVLPLLASDAPVVTWWHGPAPERLARDALGVLAGRRITDATAAENPLKELKKRARDYAPGDTDLAWTRTTPWRGLLASAFDDSPDGVTSATVQAEAGNPSAALLAGWLGSRLGVRAKVTQSRGPGITGVEVKFRGNGRIAIDRPDGHVATLSRTGRGDRQLPLRRRQLGELIAEELRRLDADEPYAEALEEATGVRDLSSREPMRTLEWQDPAAQSRRNGSTRNTGPKKTASKKTPSKKGASTSTTAKKSASKKGSTKKSVPGKPAAKKAR